METSSNGINVNASENIEGLSSNQIFNHQFKGIAINNPLMKTNTWLSDRGPGLVIKNAGDCFAMKPVFDKHERPFTNYDPADLNQYQVL